MIDLRNEPYKRAKLAKAKLSAGLVWIETFRRGDEKKKILDYIREDQLTAKGVDGDGLIIRGDTLKMEDKQWWNDKILELTDDSLAKLREDYKKRLQDYARDVLLGRR